MEPKARRSVLVVDSDPRSLAALATLCGSLGWSVRTADRYAAALAGAASSPDCLVVAEHLGDGSAFLLFRRLRALNPRLEAVMVTRTPSITQAVQAIRAGFRDYRCVAVDRACLEGLFDGDAVEPFAGAKEVAPANRSLERVQWDHIQSVLTEARGNVSQAARLLGLHRRSLQRKLSRHVPELAR
jgi:two-component system response regulator RegA